MDDPKTFNTYPGHLAVNDYPLSLLRQSNELKKCSAVRLIQTRVLSCKAYLHAKLQTSVCSHSHE